MKILVADDSSKMRVRIRDLLSELKKVEIIEAANGIEVIQAISSGMPDLIILDMRMPLMNGIDTLKKIREIDRNVIVCIVTNYPYKQYRDKCIELGANHFIDKNHEMEILGDIASELNSHN